MSLVYVWAFSETNTCCKSHTRVSKVKIQYTNGVIVGATCIHEGKLAELQDLYNIKGVQLIYIILSLV